MRRWGASALVLAIGLSAAAARAEFEASTTAPTPARAQERPWALSSTVLVGWNDNVIRTPDETFFVGETASGFVNVTLQGRYRLLQHAGWSLEASGEAGKLLYLSEGSGHTEDGDDLRDYDVTVLAPAVAVSRTTPILGRPGRFSAGYSFRQEAFPKSGTWLGAHTLSVAASAQVTPTTTVNADAALSDKNFAATFDEPELNSRDGQAVSLGVSVEKRLGPWGHRLTASYRYAENDADGANYDYTGHSVSGRIEAPLAGRVWVGLEAAADFRDYEGFVSPAVAPPGRTEQQVYTLRAEAAMPVTRRVSANLSVTASSYESNTPQFESDQTVVALGLRYRF